MKCPKCRRSIESDSNYCEFCGAQLKKNNLLRRIFGGTCGRMGRLASVGGGTVKEDNSSKVQYFILKVNPSSSNVYVDGKHREVCNGVATILLPYGKHDYNVDAAGYEEQRGEVVVGAERIEKQIVLASCLSEVSIVCKNAEALLYVNNRLMGNGSCTCKLDFGIYIIEARKEGCETVEQQIEIDKKIKKKVILDAPKRKLGKIDVTSNPEGATVYVDGKGVGFSPNAFSLTVGQHSIAIKKRLFQISNKFGHLIMLNIHTLRDIIKSTILHSSKMVKYDNGDRYVGSFDSNGSRSGFGTYYWPNGNEYEGDWKDHYRNGQGTFYWAVGDKYEGDWKDDKRYGRGTYYFADGRKYEGDWKDSKKDGRGTFYWPDGDKYEGDWKDDKRDGRGTYYFADGREYNGSWKDEKMNGRGTFYWPDGKKYAGMFQDGKMNGLGMFHWPNRDRYDGEFKDDNLNGIGVYHFADGKYRKCEYKDGKWVRWID